MTDNDLRNLTRYQLIALLKEKEKEILELQDLIASQEARIANRQIQIDKAGSIAEAALNASDFIRSAQQAADEYLINVEQLMARKKLEAVKLLEETQKLCDVQKEMTGRECDDMRCTAQKQCEEKIQETQLQCADLLKETQAACDRAWENIITRIAEYIQRSEVTIQDLEKENLL